MNKDFVPHIESSELKELGFDEPCLAYYLLPEIERTGDVLLHYCSRGKEIIRNNNWSWVYENFPSFRKYLKAEHCYTYSTNSSRLISSAPTFSQAFRWFRENYDLFGVVEGKGYEHKRYYIYSINGKWHPSQPAIDTYEEAELACLKELIKISKNK